MISTEALFPLLVVCGAIWLACGIATLIWGRKLPRQGDWLAGLPLLPWITFCGIGISLLSDDHFLPKLWLKGWIGPRGEPSAITVGVIQDPMGLVFAVMAALLVGIIFVDRGPLAREKAPERSYAALSIASVGVAVAAIAATPWLVLCGLTLCLLGGFLCLGSRWESDRGASLSVRFGWERSWGLFVAAIGLCLLASGRGEISWVKDSILPGGDAGSALTVRVGAILLISGLFVQFGSFPFLGSVLEPSTALMPVRVLTTQIFPAWCSLIMLVRFDSALRDLGLFPVLGWLGFGSAALSLASGLLQTEWRPGLAAAVSSGFSLSLAALAFAGPRAGVAILITVALGGLAMAVAGDALEGEPTKKSSNNNRAGWSRAGSALGAACLAGFLGFVSLSGTFQLALKLFEDPPALAVFLIVALLLATLTWSVHWRISRLPGSASPRWAAIVIPFLLSILGLSVVWTGSATGGLIPGGGDQLTHSVFDLFFAGTPPVVDPGIFVSVAPMMGAVILIGLFIGYWTTGRGSDTWAKLHETAPGFARFLGSGYGVDRGIERILFGVVRLGQGGEWLFSSQLWEKWVPNILAASVRQSARVVARADDRMSEGLSVGIRKGVEAPAKLLQLIQNGDVRWYLFFAIGSGIAMLLHFARL